MSWKALLLSLLLSSEVMSAHQCYSSQSQNQHEHYSDHAGCHKASVRVTVHIKPLMIGTSRGMFVTMQIVYMLQSLRSLLVLTFYLLQSNNHKAE